MVGAGCFTVLLLVSGRMRAVIDGTRNLRAMVLLTIGAVVGPVIGVTLFMASVQRVPTSVTQTILATMPILMLPIADYVYGERITRGAIAGTFVAVAGVVVLCW
jgi:drug/metabolite transporter (DMT)-like permease